MSSSYWYQYATTSNRIKQTYVNGFLDISGDLVVRNNNFSINGLISQNTDVAATNAQYTYISWNDVSGTFATVGNPSFSNNITVVQNTKTTTLSVTGDSSLNNLFLSGNLAVGKTTVTAGSALDLSGVALVSSKLAINNATYASMTNSSTNTRLLVTSDSTGTNADVSGQIVLTGSTNTNSRMGLMLDTTTANFPIGKIQVNQTNVGGGERLALNPAGGKVGVNVVPDASGTQLEVTGGIASKEPVVSGSGANSGVGTFVKTMNSGKWYKLASCGESQSKVTFRVVGLVSCLNNSYNVDVTTTYNTGATAPRSSILLNNIVGGNVFTEANIDFVVVYDSTNNTSSYYIKCNSNGVYSALTIYVTVKNGGNNNYSKLEFYQDAEFTLGFGNTISSAVDRELSSAITQFVISTDTTNTTYPMTVVAGGNVAIGKTTASASLDISGNTLISGNTIISGNMGIKNNNPAFALDISGTSNIGLTNGGVGLYLNSYSSTVGPYLSLKHNGTSGKEWLIGSTGSANVGGAGLLQFYDQTVNQWRLQIGTAGGLQIKQPQYRDATMTFINTNTKSSIRIAGDADENDALCIGLWGDTIGNNSTGYIQNSIDNTGTSAQARELLLNPLGGNVAVGKTTAATALDVSGGISHPVYAILQPATTAGGVFTITTSIIDLTFYNNNNTATDNNFNGQYNIGKGISLITTANTPGGTTAAQSVIKIDYPGLYMINSKLNVDTAMTNFISIEINVWSTSNTWVQSSSDQMNAAWTSASAFNSTNFIPFYNTPPFYIKFRVSGGATTTISNSILWSSVNIVKIA